MMNRVFIGLAGLLLLISVLLVMLLTLFGRILPTKQIAYVAAPRNRSAIYLLDLYHHIALKLINDAYTPAWSPDGNRLAFYSTRDGGRDLYIMSLPDLHLQRLTNNAASNNSPSWSPDGTEIVFASDYDNSYAIYRMLVDCVGTFETCAKRLTPKDQFWYAAPAWSPDGRTIAFTTTKDTTSILDDSLGNSNIYIMNSDGSNSRRLTDNLGEDYTPSWSPDSRSIVYSAQNIQFGTAEIMITTPNCSSQAGCSRVLFTDVVDLMPAWSADGGSIAFVDAHQGSFEIYSIDPTGQYLQRITFNNFDENTPRWRP